jgi:mannosyl-oligosaccharide alpha-1,2-mannosidase
MLEHICEHGVCSALTHFYCGTYNGLSCRTGIGPEVFAYTSSDGSYTGDSAPTADQLAFNSKYGFYITASDYILRPEVLESNFYAWRITGDKKYLDRAASAIASFNTYLSVNHAYSGITDVNSKSSSKYDTMESFWFAEVLKYL